VNVRLWGTRGSLPTPGEAHASYGGNTSCVAVSTGDARCLTVIDAGTGIRALGDALPEDIGRVDILLSHLHLDHIIGLGFFSALTCPGLDVHVWGPASQVLGLHTRLSRYLSPPLFPLRLRDLPCRLELHEVLPGRFEVPGLEVSAALICHPGATLGYRLDDGTGTVTYLSDHEPALGARVFPEAPEWTSGYDLAAGADLLIHDAQYEDGEYPDHVGWGHSTVSHALALAGVAGVRHLVAFHHDPAHDDRSLDRIYAGVPSTSTLMVTPAREGSTFVVGRQAAAPAQRVPGRQS
jgi:phosphoribosyl 1,2-cyclic phosphodiesterase